MPLDISITPVQLHKAMISTLMAIEKLQEAIHRNSFIDRGNSDLRHCRELLDDAHKHLAFDETEQKPADDTG